MKIIVNGQQAFGKACLEAILERGLDQVVAVYCAPDKQGKPIDPIKEFALEKGLKLIQPPNYKDAEVLDEMRALHADLCVMAYMIIFVPKEARDIPTHGSICFHPSLLPKHRGPSSINWAIIGGAAKTGLTIFWPDDGFDEGDVLLQKEVDIGPDDTLGSVYFNKIFPLGLEAVVEAIDLVRAGDPPRIKQDELQATYESWCNKPAAEIDWSKPAAAVDGQIRGLSPFPGAWFTAQTEKGPVRVKVLACRREGGEGAPGEVLDGDLLVACGEGAVRLMRLQREGRGPQESDVFLRGFPLPAGTRLA